MKYRLDWNKIKYEVDIEQYFLFKMGSIYQYDKYKQAYILSDNNHSGDIIRFFRHKVTQVKMYYSIGNQDSGDIIQFIKKRVLNNTSAQPEEINNELRLFFGLYSSNHVERTSEIYYASSFKESAECNYKMNGDIIPEINMHMDYLEQYRKLSRSTYLSKIFESIFFTYKKNNIFSLSYLVKDINGVTVGIHRVFTKKGDYFNKKWFDNDTKNSIGFTFSQRPKITETLSVFESIFDAMSYAELFRHTNMQYCSSNGELSFHKAKMIRQYFLNNNFRKLIAANDNDISGIYFNLNIVASFISEVQKVQKTTHTVIMDIVSVNHRNFNVLKQFFRKLNMTPKNFNDRKLVMTYFTETLSQDESKFIFIISNTIDSVKFFTNLILKIWELDKFIVIHHPIGKDFNDDLIQQKTFKHD